MVAAVTPAHAQELAENSHTLFARDAVDKIAGSVRDLLSSPTDGDLASRALRKDHRNLRRETARALQQGVIEVPPPDTSEGTGGVEVADFKAELLVELASLDVYVSSPEFDEDEAAAVNQEGSVLAWICDKTVGKLFTWYVWRKGTGRYYL